MIGSYLKDEVTIHTSTLDKWNKKIDNTQKVKAFVESKRKWTKNSAGAAVLSEATVYLKTRELSLSDRIEFEGRVWGILSIAKGRDFAARFLEVTVA